MEMAKWVSSVQACDICGNSSIRDVYSNHHSNFAGKVSWYVPKRTAQRYPFTITYLGLKENREKLAEIFHRPVSWRDYCHQVSATNCSQPDEVASRYPETEELGHKYFFSDGYIGHFRPTDKNDCGIVDPNATSVTATESNLTCTGHIVNAKCSWSTFLEAQAYWNDIALESNGPDWINGGYAYDDIVDIWQAANATQSDVISFFFEPAFASQQFRNTDYEYTKVVLPATTIQCRNSRVPPSDRCSVDTTVRRGLLEGSCDDNAHATKQVVAISLRDNTVATSDAYRSPAYAFVRNFNIDELELGEMLFEFARRGQTGHAAREVVCEWVGNNMEYVSSFIPPSHPRAVIPKTNKRQVVEVVAYSVGAFAVLYVVAATVEMYEKRTMKVFLYAQVKFIFVVLFGLLLVAIASILYVVEPSVVVCTTEFWLVAIGYTCMLVPLIIKVSAMNQLMRASARMRRIRIRTNALYAKVMAWLIVVTIFLVVWTAVDAPRPIQLRTLSEDRTTIFTETGCMSSSEYWVVIYLSWEMLLAISAFVLAFQSRKAKAEFNESKSLCMMIYSHLGFACLRIIAFYVLDEDDMHLQAVGTSLFLSLDVIMAVTIYLIPKFYLCHELEKPRQSELQGSATVREIQARAQSSTIQSLRESSVRIILGNQTTLTENTIEGLEPPVENADKRAGTIVTGAGNQNESEKQEQDDAMEKAKAPIIEDDSNDISSSTNLRHRVAAQGNSSVTNSSPSHQSGENRRLSAFPQLASARSFRLGRGISSRAASFRHTTVAENFSKYGRKSVDLLFGPSADLEMIQSFREMAGDSDESEYDLGMISEDVDNNEVGERGNNTSGDDSLVDSGDDSRPKIWTRNSQFSKSDESLTASKNVKVMDA